MTDSRTIRVSWSALKRASFWSFFLHGSLLLFVFLYTWISGWELFERHQEKIEPALRVDIVSLPDIQKKDLKDLTPSLPNPEPPPPEKMEEKKAPERSEIAIKPQVRETINRMRAVEMIKEKLAKVDDKKKDAPPSQPIKGNKVAVGNSLNAPARIDASSWNAHVLSLANSLWELPPHLKSQKRLYAVAILYVGANGMVLNAIIEKSSQNIEYDGQVKNVITQLTQLPPPPEDIAAIVRTRGVVLRFVPDTIDDHSNR